jgi:hypothetical protein
MHNLPIFEWIKVKIEQSNEYTKFSLEIIISMKTTLSREILSF